MFSFFLVVVVVVAVVVFVWVDVVVVVFAVLDKRLISHQIIITMWLTLKGLISSVFQELRRWDRMSMHSFCAVYLKMQ